MTEKNSKTRSHHAGATCSHPKPAFSNGKLRKFCYACAPKPEPKPRKPYTPKVCSQGTCANAVCASVFVMAVPSQRFCSEKCRYTVTNAVGYERRRSDIVRECEHCKKSFSPLRGARQIRYCSSGCATDARRLTRTGTTHRRRAKKYGCEYEPVDKQTVFERDGWQCYICLCDTPKEMRGTKAGNAPELDHVAPLSKGGAHSYENTRCACRRCNLAKGARELGAMPTPPPKVHRVGTGNRPSSPVCAPAK